MTRPFTRKVAKRTFVWELRGFRPSRQMKIKRMHGDLEGCSEAENLPTRCAGGTYFSTHKKEHTPDALRCIAGFSVRCIAYALSKSKKSQGIAADRYETAPISESLCASPRGAMHMRCASDAYAHRFSARSARTMKTRDAVLHRHTWRRIDG